MTFLRRWAAPAALAAVTALGGCAYRVPAYEAGPGPAYGGGYGQPRPPADAADGYRRGADPGEFVAYGQVLRIEAVRRDERGRGSGAGAAIGGVVGAILGHEVGTGPNGRATGSFIGAVLGALIGNEIERDQAERREPGVRVTIGLDRGGTRTFVFRDAGDLRIGDRVRVEGDRVVRMPYH